MQPNQQAHQ
jgi:hypothetical protein